MSAFALAFATEYKKYMKAHKVRQRQIAEYLGFTEAYVSERVNGKRAIDTNDVDALAALSGTTGRSLMIELAPRKHCASRYPRQPRWRPSSKRS